MSVDPRISATIVLKEIEDCQKDIDRYGWDIFEIDNENQYFVVKMSSPVDGEVYILEIQFDNYKEWPLLIEFIDPQTGEAGSKKAYPQDGRKPGLGNLFHSHPCICHPSSRKAHKGYSDVHKDWNPEGWQGYPQIGSLTNIRAILQAIYSRISNPEIYQGRMK